MRDWSSAFRRASFRGVRFWVDEDGPEVGRRVAVHEISGGNVPVVEDMGRRATRFTVSAYVASDLADIEGLALERACATDGPAVLRLPMDPSQLVYCEGCRRNRRKNKNGVITYDLAFVTAGGPGGAAASALGAMRGTMANALGAVGAALAGAF
ncbi:hypothetical protein Sa4125_25080 [Aureimonas sp. SA4125]|uniref:DNA circularization N-terminal domain-containing protein n=1 Tax=Aureimonas sp. SA4125 TaxID=2826993 RepID=UPI001CC4A870|nr:DNA circularization N-terminal domain-containing protein [Aureimonas sp. SA4125]BDA84966.1 hypothetical protein Sa4125_25080 [Aureimonas sp. SA4125]